MKKVVIRDMVKYDFIFMLGLIQKQTLRNWRQVIYLRVDRNE